VSRRVITISRKKWGKSATKTERIIRDAIPKADTMSSIEEYLLKAKSVTSFDLANRFNIRMSIARQILRKKEAEGVVVPYIREGGFVVYTTPAELEKREEGAPIMVADALEEIASSVPKQTIITEEMDEALLAAGTPGAVKPSKLAWKRREVGEKKERKDERPEVVVEPLEPQPAPELEPEKKPKKAPAKKKAAPKKKSPAKKKVEKKEAPKKKPAKKKAAPKKKAEEKKPAKKKAAPKKKAEEKKPAKKKAVPKKTPTKKKTTKKKAEEKSPAKKKTTTKKKAEEKKPAKKTTTKKKAAEKKPAKKTTKKKKE
jgi:ribosomal protein S25